MSAIVNVLRAIVADGSELSVISSKLSIHVFIAKRYPSGRLVSADRIVPITAGDDALCVALTELYLQLRNGHSASLRCAERN